MKRAILLGLGALGVSAAAIPAIAVAQGFPPPPPATFYGTVPSGVVPGQGVIAIVTNGSASATCGAGIVSTDGSATVYVVDVVADAQQTGCGKAGAKVSFYFTPTSGGGGRLATDTFDWNGAGPANKNITNLGSALTRRGAGILLAKDGTS